MITKLVNLSMASGTFPNMWKEAIMLPLLKKSGIQPILKNYRPVSNLPFISKIVERCVVGQLNDHLKQHSILPDFQSAYRAGYSTGTALVKVHNDIVRNIDDKRLTLMVLIDLSAAFDTVDHPILLNVLKHKFGMQGISLNWFHSFLHDRYFKVLINDSFSNTCHLQSGVPQGSCAGPVLYTAYMPALLLISFKSTFLVVWATVC